MYRKYLDIEKFFLINILKIFDLVLVKDKKIFVIIILVFEILL